MTKTVRLSQAVASVSELKSAGKQNLTGLMRILEKPNNFEGITKIYHPKDDEGTKLPSEGRLPTYQSEKILEQIPLTLEKLFNTAATQDYGNAEAKADIIIDEKTIMSDVPVTHLLFLETQLKDLETCITSAATLPLGVEWKRDIEAMAFKTEPKVTLRTVKEQSFVTAVEPTPEHPAIVKDVTKDVIVGEWETTQMNTALPLSLKSSILTRIQKLQKAVVDARIEANTTKVQVVNVADPIFNYLFSATSD